MRPGETGFAEAVFSCGEVVTTEVPNMELFGLKRPSAAMVHKKLASLMKRPAAASQPSQADDETEDESEPEDDELEVQEPTGLQMPTVHAGDKAFPFSDGTKLKLGQFTGQSYITFKEPLKLKFKLLIACSDNMAARNGKHLCHDE